MAPTHTITFRNGPNSAAAHIRLEVDGVVLQGGKGHVEFDLKNQTKDYQFRGRVTAFDYSGQFSVEVEGVPFRAREILGYDTRTGAATAESPAKTTTDVAPSPSDITRDTASLSNIGTDNAIGGGAFHDVPNPVPSDGHVSRYATTKRDQEIVVDPNEAGGVQKVLNRLPYRIEHNIKIRLADGNHTGNGSSCRTGPTQVNSRGRLYIEGDHYNQCRVAAGLNGTYGVAKQEHNKVTGIHWDGLSQFSGPIDLRNCRFSGFAKPGANSSGTAAISGKNGQVHAKGCLIGESLDDYAIWATLMEEYSLTDCTLRARVAAINAAPGCNVGTYGCTIDAPRKFA